MANWQKVTPQGKAVLKQLDDAQRNARERGKDPLPDSVTRKMVDRVVKPVDPNNP